MVERTVDFLHFSSSYYQPSRFRVMDIDVVVCLWYLSLVFCLWVRGYRSPQPYV